MKPFKLLIVLILSCFYMMAYSEDYLNTMLQPEQVAEDLNQWIQFLDKTHPQLSYTVDNVEAFYGDVEKLKSSITQPISVLEFWRLVSSFNRALNDGHTVINLPKLRELANQHVRSGGGLFPYQVVFSNNRLFIRSELHGKPTKFKGYEITKINGQNIRDFVEPLLERTNGDSKRFRKALLQRRFATYIWLYYGNIKTFDLVMRKCGEEQKVTVVASREAFAQDKTFSDNFKFEMLDTSNALLTINTFSWGEDYADVIEFLHLSFSKIAKSNIQHLIIDIRENGGGDDKIWIDGILPYIADKKWRTGSHYKVKVIEGRAREGQSVGDVIEGQNSFKEVNSDVTEFKGDVSVLISDFTYSSAILFANVIQDHGFGLLVGEATGGKSGQTGGTQATSLKYSKLRVISPRFYLERPKGGSNNKSVKPDIIIDYDKNEPFQLVSELIKHRSLNIKSSKWQTK
ncbi:S41 family peptidase [Pleionea sp. CnH1-48]|uniref:S41 family peptidase n=1 Tax=Pleionea sp. CnH1-48 TaxID=2954494 RepID=UPI002096D694|nr:S41 family peptidase [Pleionea sp. CnH1-48]MCO7225357.1 S41 family peptidase [Pleionea sp. CnH1-48]